MLKRRKVEGREEEEVEARAPSSERESPKGSEGEEAKLRL